MTPKKSVGGTIAAHLDAGTIVTALVGSLMSYMVNMGVGKLDKLTDEVTQLNEKVATAVERSLWQEKRDTQQDERLRSIEDKLLKMRK